MGDEDGGWSTIESSPAIFSELLAGIGLPGLQVEEVYALDRDLLTSIQPIHGLFAPTQVIQNACATQALLSIALNSPGVTLPAELSDLLTFTADFDATMKGLAISNSETLRSVHNSFSPQQFVVENSPLPEHEKETPYHFISYIPFKGHVFELDGLAGGARQHGDYTESKDWLEVVTPVIEARMAEYSAEGEIRFTLLAVCDDIAARLKAESAANPGDADLAFRARQEAEKRETWKRETARRKHNFLPFIIETLKSLAKAGLIEGIVEEATKRKEKRLEEEKRAKDAAAGGPN